MADAAWDHDSVGDASLAQNTAFLVQRGAQIEPVRGMFHALLMVREPPLPRRGQEVGWSPALTKGSTFYTGAGRGGRRHRERPGVPAVQPSGCPRRCTACHRSGARG